MLEKHENEQYFFDEATLDHLASFVSNFESPCCICCPSLGKKLTQLGQSVAVLDIDARFSDVSGFQKFDLTEPNWVGKEFGLIVCDPPFFNVSLSQLFRSLRMLAQHKMDQPLLISYLTRRAAAVEHVFKPFNLTATGYRPTYKTVEKCDRNDIQFFSNLPDSKLEKLVLPL